MVNDQPDRISWVFSEGTPIDAALKYAVENAVEQHRRAGNPIAVWRDGKVVWLQPHEIPIAEGYPSEPGA